jgi:putative FmdB family regulatory protein
MPTYDYKCSNCGDTFEHFQKMTDGPLEECNICGGKLKRLIGAGLGPIFKGSGFYQTDYKKDSASANSVSKTEKVNKPSTEKKVSKNSDKKDPA